MQSPSSLIAFGGAANGGHNFTQGPETLNFLAINAHVYCSMKTASALTRPASRPQQRACAHVYADAVLTVQYIGSPRPVVD